MSIKPASRSAQTETENIKKRSCRKRVNLFIGKQYSAGLDQRLRNLANQNRRESLSQLKEWLKYGFANALSIFLTVFFPLMVIGNILFLVVQFWSIVFDFIEELVDRFGVFFSVGVVLLTQVMNSLLFSVWVFIRSSLCGRSNSKR